MSRRPGTPRLLRQLNDRAALELLLASGPLTRTQLGQETGLSKVTASQLLARLEERQLVHVVGSQAGGRGPNAALYAVVPSSAYALALDVRADEVTGAVADITGQVIGDFTVDPAETGDPGERVHAAVMDLLRRCEVPLDRLSGATIGTPGVVDPRTGGVRFSFDLHTWLEGAFQALRADLGPFVRIENDVNLAALAEHAEGAAEDVSDFVLIWLGKGGGVGMAIMLDDRIHTGVTGGAGEIGYLPVPGAPLPGDVGLPGDYHSLRRTRDQPTIAHGFQALVGAQEIRALGEGHGFTGKDVGELLAAACAAGAEGDAFLDELAERIARGVAAVCVVLDPGLVVLGGEVAQGGGDNLAGRVARATARIGPNAPQVGVGRVESPVLRGALLRALQHAREDVFDSTVG
ncbi:ROK family protein [Streptomonospora nanhaiensis]|uniref:Putative NBD/HSP70 family sugar kinase n=1 Tax=Streptomonospora nanhaiensis TaxID=1323731 RepID=A0A853BKC4_9ACTN|nr:ROK family transcriptional regulator [Streptomonospora nanhaiensis]MBV2363109.1 ROK family transcriptional regulator [Streptomonospora nanhaiensis]MBX9390389.1 ROK family transcriptional regulator [Streptomonospora nanhaiensis]NYI95480.1 putative NBD/HSP70 family sugar kinase [Streptomonospora nanhaiensis]